MSHLLIILGILAMILTMLICNKFYRVPFFKLLVCAVMLPVTTMLGGFLMYYIESGQWGNGSLYGAILFAPPMMYAVAKLVGAPASDIVDMCVPAGCIFLASQKINCLRTGCCIGRIIGYTGSGEPVRFPSQILECAAALLICIFLYWLISEGKNRGRIYPWFLLLYGASRYGLNLLRETTPFLWGLAAGNVWSIVAMALGIVLFAVISVRKRTPRKGAK